jgi:BirA family biotin operon repressor/biotin-[acetyl-CoA-carboxylase] ligase
MDLMDIECVRRSLTTRRIGRELIYLPSTGSTMDVARDRADQGAAEGLVVVAEEQTAGRGRLGRTWVAPAGVNLYVSILVRPSLDTMKRLGIITPLAVADAVAAVSGLDVGFKWPNDVRIGGRKLCGILIEGELSANHPDRAVVGIGLNVNLDAAAFPEIAGTATSIARELGRPVGREATLAALLNAFERRYDDPDGAALRLAWRARLETLGQEIDVTFAGHTDHGIAEDVDDDGSLILRRRDGSRITLPAGEVTLRPGGI